MTRAWTGWRWATAGAMTMAAVPALADVKAGVDAWNRGDYPRAVAEWRRPAAAGDPDAEYNMGQAYKLGRGVPADLPQAELWYQKAAAQGHSLAQDNYGLALFQDGRKSDALPWLEKSVARDEKRAELVLGDMLFNGDAVPRDWVRAYALVSRSSQQGLPQASQTLAQMDGYVSAEQRQQGIALAGRLADQGRLAQLAALDDLPPVRNADGPTGPVPAKSEQSPRPIATTDVPSSTAPARHRTSEREQPHPSSRTETAKAEPAQAHPASPSVQAQSGHWKVQLGAFRDEGNARALWSRVGGHVGGRAIYAKAGGVTRLQAGPFASKGDAERACRAAGSGCVVLP